MNEVKIPEQFILSPFLKEDEKLPICKDIDFTEAIKINPLIFDLYDKLQIEDLKPWEEKHKYIPIILESWKSTEPVIASLFENRDREKALEPMKNMVLLFLMFLFWLNDRPVPALNGMNADLKDLKIKPVNVGERLDYILSIPNHYHAFIQLQQLFIELNKKYAVVKKQDQASN